jgi:thiol-disulfide isomerase/thioredoxin
MKKLVMLGILISVFTLACAEGRGDAAGLVAKAGFQTPTTPLTSTDFKLPGLDGDMVKLSDFRGSLVLLNFWATWCPPCKAEIPSLESLYGRLKSKGLKVLSVDLGEEKSTVQDFVTKNKMETTVLLDTKAEVGIAYGTQSIPVTYIIARDGSILGRTIGSRDWTSSEVSTLLENLLAAK